MKSLFGAAIVAILATQAQAVIVSVNTGAFAGAVANNAGTAISFGTGFIQVGVLNSAFDGILATTTAADISANFTAFTNSIGTFGQSVSGTDYPGFVNFATSGLRVDGNPPDAFFNKNIYVLLGNGANLLGSSQLSVFKANLVFPDDSEAAIDATPDINLLTAQGTWLLGAPSGGQTNAGGFPVNNAATMAVLVPEPSAALLGALGALGLLRRRRI
jgi:hypothetical protein